MKEKTTMERIFDKAPYLTQNHEKAIALFERTEEFEIFQMRMGLETLCQNTLVYPVGKSSDGLHYDMHTSPHSKKFFHIKCLKYCEKKENINLCNQMMYHITKWFCESYPISDLNLPDISICTYGEMGAKKQYIIYQCPFVHLYKCAFPIYVGGSVVAVLFVGQFPIGTSGNNFPYVKIKRSIPDGTPELVFNRYFENKETLTKFIEKSLTPIVLSFTQKAQDNFFQKQEEILLEKIKEQITYMEKEIISLLITIKNDFDFDDTGGATRSNFWNIVSKSLVPYLKVIGTNNLFVFIDESSILDYGSKSVNGTQLFPTVSYKNPLYFNFCFAAGGNKAIYTRNKKKGIQTNEILFSYLKGNEILGSHEQCDIVLYKGNLQPFAIAIKYLPSAKILNNGILRRKVLEHLELFFSKVGQELVHLSILRSEKINKSVLRIYRHEIIHQIEVLNHNNAFLDLKKLRETDENKIRHVAEDQLQCIHELDFITHNINVFTGKVSRHSTDIDKNQLIDVDSNIINKSISLYQRVKRDKFLWFVIQNNTINSTIKSNQSLLDMIFFNLMSNAIKYSYPGTKVIIGIQDTDSYSRPHRITLTDFGAPIEADYPDQIFQMYFRGDSAVAQIEGSGIGLYVANEVANILDARLTWTSEKVSDYNIPILMRQLNLPPLLRKYSLTSPHLIQAEYLRLQKSGYLTQIFNDDYLTNPNEWNQLEMQEELFRPTFRVTFRIEL